MRKILYLKWDCFCEEYICDAFIKAGFTIEYYELPYGKISMRYDSNEIQKLQCKIEEQNYEFIYSFNFFPLVSIVAEKMQIKYISWTYDSPFMFLYSKQIYNAMNVAFCFDSETIKRLDGMGVKNAYYLPMAAPVGTYDKHFSSALERKKYGSDIAFVGSTYMEDRQDLMKQLNGLPEEITQYLNQIMELQLQSYAVPILENLLNPTIVDFMQQVCPLTIGTDEMQSKSWMYANYYLARQVTARERTRLLTTISSKWKTKLFTPSSTPELPNVINLGPVDYCNEMPHVFKNTKINLNISLQSIETGIPLRAFDIMGCEGFCYLIFRRILVIVLLLEKIMSFIPR